MVSRKRPFDGISWVSGPLELKTEFSEEETQLLAENFAQMDPWKRLGFSSEVLKRYFVATDSSRIVVTISSSQTLIGVVVIRYPWLRGPFIEFLGFFEAAQQKGHGREVLVWIESEMKEHDQNLWITASAFNEAALKAYDRLGFTRVGVLPDLVRPGEHEVLLRKTL
jgi:ribosomal protein S18 acetylase RimI-like enzyme